VGKVRIVTDSSAHFLDPSVIDRYDIKVVPLSIRLGDQSFREGVELDADAFFKLADHFNPSVTVTAPDVEEFSAVYNKLSRQTDQIISIHMSRPLNPIWDQARAASKALLGRCAIEVVDSQTTSVGLALLVEEVAKIAETGASLEEVVREARGMIGRVYSVFFVETLDYLRHNGLLSEAQSILGAMLNIKPFLTIEEGELIPMEKVRTQTQAIDKLVEFATEFAVIERLVIVQSTPYPTDQTRQLQDRLAAEFPNRTFPVMMYGPSLAAMIGPDGLGIVVYEGLEDEEEA
jgi:DegV family protein with EDD domain